MITCPECGEKAPDDAKFCDRCGQGLSRSVSAPSSPTRPTPLTAGATLKGGLVIVELIGQTSIENRYRAKQTGHGNSGTATITLRERLFARGQQQPCGRQARTRRPEKIAPVWCRRVHTHNVNG